MSKLVLVLKALSDENRLKIVKLLLSHHYCVRALSYRLGISESAVSQHLKILKNSGLAKGMKKGYYTHYYIDRDLLRKAADEVAQLANLPVVEHICQKDKKKG